MAKGTGLTEELQKLKAERDRARAERDELGMRWYKTAGLLKASDDRIKLLVIERDAARELAGLTWTVPDVDAWGRFADERGATGIRDRLNRLFRRAVTAEEQVRQLLNDADRQGQGAVQEVSGRAALAERGGAE